MARYKLTDPEIAALLAEPKRLESDFGSQLTLKQRPGHFVAEMDITGDQGSSFKVMLRRAQADPLDFSVILGYTPPGSGTLIRLRRYNGPSHQHTNPREGTQFAFCTHIHSATERYMRGGDKEESYAEPTGRYVDMQGALDCLLEDCGFVLPPGAAPVLPFGDDDES